MGVEEWLVRERSSFQEIAIARVPEFGRGLFLDANVQFLELDEFVYHEHLVLPPLLYHPAPRRVLIQGGGDGLALREVLRDRRVEEVVLVEIDGRVLEACAQHLSDLQRGSLDDSRTQIVVQDALAYMREGHGRFDVIIGDLVDVYGSRSRSLYQRVLVESQSALAPGGVLCLFGDLGAPHFFLMPLYVELKRAFRYRELHRAWIESFSSPYGFLLASNEVDFRSLSTQTLIDRASQLIGPLQSLVPEQFPAAFMLPRYLKDRIDALLRGDSAAPPATGEGTFGWWSPDN